MPSTTSLKSFAIFGGIFTIILGTLLHFAYSLSGDNSLVGLLTPINESVWEHLKLGFFAFLLYAILIYPTIKNQANNYWFAVAASTLILNLVILLIFYTYTFITGTSILWIDISSFILGSIVAAYTFYNLITRPPLPKWLNLLGIVIILLTIGSFFYFTIAPPPLPLFTSPV